jgi:hypothetical protein
MCRWEIPPADMWYVPDLHNCLSRNCTWDDDFVALDIIQAHTESNRFGCAHTRMWLIIAANPYLLAIGKTKRDATHLALPTAFQFPHPLMRGVKFGTTGIA